MPALQHFFNAERVGRGWTMKEAAKRSQISLSKAYAISNGDDNVEFETFENIAAAFNMSPAELAVAIGKGSAADDPKRVTIHAALRDVPDEQLATVNLMIRGLAVAANASGEGTATHSGRTINGRRRGLLPPIESHYRWGSNVLAFVRAPFARQPARLQAAAIG